MKTKKKSAEEISLSLLVSGYFVSFSTFTCLNSYFSQLLFFFQALHKTPMQAFKNGSCWPEFLTRLNCIINYCAGSGVEANPERGRENREEA